MALNDTDPEESVSESDSSSDRDSAVEQLDEEDIEDSGEESGDDDAEESTQARISLSDAFRDPVYVMSLDPDIRACILCKDKVIKGTVMSQLHKTSTGCTFLKHEYIRMFRIPQAHKRRFDRFKSLSAKIDQNADA